MKRAKTLNEAASILASLSVGRVFTDHLGQQVERLSYEPELAVSVGPGYNNILSIPEYLRLAEEGVRYGRYVIPA